jgi:probable HAF family extracellular repeat protein
MSRCNTNLLRSHLTNAVATWPGRIRVTAQRAVAATRRSTYERNLPSTLVIVLAVAIAEVVSAEDTLAQTAEYTVLQVSAASGQVVRRINSFGDIVGRAGNSVGGGTGAATWSHGTFGLKRLGALPGGDHSSAFAINDAGQVAGASNTATAIVPFIWKPNGGLQRIPLLPGDKCGQAFGINKSGHVVGYSSGPNGVRAFLWVPGAAVRNLGFLPGGASSKARAVNHYDEVAGTAGSPAGDRAVLWTNTGQVRDLGTLPGDTSSEATAINNAGEVVGYSRGPGGLHAFVWTAAAGMQNLGVLSGGTSSRALDINDLGYVVGSSNSSSGDRAFIWTKQAGLRDLNNVSAASPGVVLVEADSINATGEILATGKITDPNAETSQAHEHCAPAPPSSFLLIPIL